YAKGQRIEVVEIDYTDNRTDLEHLKKELNDEIAGVVVQYPNFFGEIEPLKEIKSIVEQQKKTMMLVSSNPLALGYLTPPGEVGAATVDAETQVISIPGKLRRPHCG